MKLYLMSVLFMSLATAAPAPALPTAYDRRQPSRRGEPHVGIIRHGDLLNFSSPTATAAVVTSPAQSSKLIAEKATGTGTCTGTATHVHVARATGTDSVASVHESAPTHHNDKAVEYKFPSPTIAAADVPIAVGHWWLQ